VSHSRTPEGRERERLRKARYHAQPSGRTCQDCGKPVSKAATRCTRCNLKHARPTGKGGGNYGARIAPGPRAHELALMEREPPASSIFGAVRVVERWQRGEA
jgi:predicted amidophosphoribosyltransferase